MNGLQTRGEDLAQAANREEVVQILTDEHPAETPLINLHGYADGDAAAFGANTVEEVGNVMVKVLYEGNKTYRYDTLVIREIGSTTFCIGLDAVRFTGDDGEDYFFLMDENVATMDEVKDFGVRHPDGRQADDYEYIGVDYQEGFIEGLAATR